MNNDATDNDLRSTLLDGIPVALNAICEIAADAKASPTKRLKATFRLLVWCEQNGTCNITARQSGEMFPRISQFLLSTEAGTNAKAQDRLKAADYLLRGASLHFWEIPSQFLRTK